ncbi:hypothetical protein [Parasulfitobacter algicola]|uniref:Uncharacterized protein n=1 Tax=Parasulfitobacter algicola TaxID=2614809 RepID=A0ABX2IXQ3_9RHOB|nr:hypothetical protein [Sulfitobacter algicola]NSX55299.1 hypothetical protein [Sulfitobacter algicola]
MSDKNIDPKGLIREAYNIENIALPECRSIFLDWAIGVPQGRSAQRSIKALLKLYQSDHPDHPMTQVLTEGLAPAPVAKRRGGRAARIKN